MRTNLHHLIQEQAGRRPDDPAVTFKEETFSYAEVWRQVVSVAAGLKAIGVERGDRVAILLDKRIENVAAIFGTSVVGGVFVPVNHLLRPNQIGYILADCDVRVLITSADRLPMLTDELKSCPSLEHVLVTDSSDDFETLAPDEFAVHRWSDVCDDLDASQLAPTGVIDIDIASIFYTSGSTGKPKGVVLSHRNLLVGAESVSEYLANRPDDVILSALPLSFDAGFSQLTTAFSAGAHVVLLNYFLPRDLVKLCVRHGVTGLTGVPPLWIQLAEQEWPSEAAATMRYFANTGGRMPKATLERLRLLFPTAEPFLMYGLTEAFRSTYLDPAEVDRRPDSIGKAIPNAEIVVARPNGTRCDPGEEGELVHRGALVALGYWNDPERTAERYRPAPGASASGHLAELAVWSGDMVTADEDGFLYFVGRKDDMIKTSGYRVSPTEIEEVAYDSGCVRDAVALGIPDERLGQRILLIVTPLPGQVVDTPSLLTAMKRQLPLYMTPSKIVVRDNLPKSPNGKFDRNLLRMESGQ